MHAISHYKLGFVGTGNMSQAIIHALVDLGGFPASNIMATNRTPGKLEKLKQKVGIQTLTNNEELADACDIIFVCVKPQDFQEAIDPFAKSLTSKQIVVSLAAGLSLDHLTRLFPHTRNIVRIMPNTAVRIGRGVVGFAATKEAQIYESMFEELLSSLGLVLKVEEGESFEALTVACGSGIGFVFELMLYWQEWLEEHGFEEADAQAMTVNTFLGASLLAKDDPGSSLELLQSRVVSKQGVTAAGLDSMQELEVERALRYSFEKAVLRDRKLGQQS